jgi:hypothetical protein
VIKIDPFFAEAYNRRATVHFGLKCADDCFADIERYACLAVLYGNIWYRFFNTHLVWNLYK